MAADVPVQLKSFHRLNDQIFYPERNTDAVNDRYNNLTTNPDNIRARKDSESAEKSPRSREREVPWIQYVIQFCNSVSILGVRFVVNVSASLTRRSIWAVLVLVGLAFTIYNIQDRFRYFFTYPVNVVYQEQYPHSMRFPTVTICSENRASLSKVSALGITETIRAIFPPFPMPFFTPNFTGYDLDQRGYNWSTLAYTMAPGYDIKYCLYNAAACTAQEMETIATNMGYCMSFNGGSRNLTAEETGSLAGLTMVLEVHQDDYLFANSASAGFRILLHDPEEKPLMLQRAVKVSPAFSTQMSVAAEINIQLPHPYGDCDPSPSYEQTKCISDCESNYVIGKCGCKDIDMEGDAPICDPKSFYGCKLRAQRFFVRDNAASRCKCRRQCRRLHYRPTISQAMLSHAAATFIHRITENNTESIQSTINDHVLIEIYFSELKYTYIRAQQAYTSLSLLCDVGGALGLILGGTMLTICEIIDFLLILAGMWIRIRTSNARTRR